MRHHRAILVAISSAATILGGCTTAASSPAGPTNAPSPTESAAPPAASRPATLGFDGRDGVLVVGRQGDPLLTAIVASSGRQLVQLPVGVPTSASWGSLATTTVSGSRTIVADAAIADGGGSTATLDGAWAPPTIGDDPTPAGLSADGKTLVLIPSGDPDPARTTSRFAIVPFPPTEGAPELAPRVVAVPGAVDFDAISPDGRILYVVQHLDGEGGYQVRAVAPMKAEQIGDAGMTEIRVHQQYPRVRGLGQRAREVDRCRGLAIADGRAGHGDDLEARALVHLLDLVAEGAILLGLERSGSEKAHEVLVHSCRDLGRCGRGRHRSDTERPRRCLYRGDIRL